MSRRLIIILALASAMVLAWLLLQKESSAGGDVLTVTARYGRNAPSGLDDPIWREIPLIPVPVEGRLDLAGIKGIVFTQAFYTDDTLFFRFKWQDPTWSIVKHSWRYDGKQWFHMDGNEDRLALLFEITRIDKFSTRGCAVTCHSPADVPREAWKLTTATPLEKGDMWHWKAARSDPYRHADDGWLTVAGNPSGSYRETGRRKDKGTGGDIKNETPDGLQPLYMQDPAIKPSAPGFLLLEEAVEIVDDSPFKPGDVIPYRLPLRPSGSRFDVKAESRYIDGQWHLMLYRKLDTGHEDDVSFNPLKRYSFAMAVFDDSGDDHSKATKALVLTFVQP